VMKGAKDTEMINEQAVREEAEGFVILGMYEEAWELVDALPPEIRATSPVLRVRLACAMAAERFDTVQEIAQVLAKAGRADAQFAARVLHELAAIHYLSGHVELAKHLMESAVEAHPDQRMSIIADPHLKHLF